MGLTLVLRGLQEFGELSLFYIGGGWCGYTYQAKEYCIEQKIGLFVTNEINGALWKNDYWTYHKRDEKRNSVYYYKTG